MPIRHQVKLGSNRVNLTGSIDRVDRLADGTISIIDYKTGNDNVNVKDVSHLFDTISDKEGHEKAILQLFIYCNAYSQIAPYNGPIMPRLYRFRKLATEGLGQISIENEPLTDYKNLNDRVMSELEKVLGRLFDPDEPFAAAPHKSHCCYCKYGQLCGQAIK